MRTSKNNYIFFISLAVLILISWSNVNASKEEKKNSCKLAGPYIGAIPGQTTFILNSIPLNKSGKEVLLVIDTTGDGDPTSGGIYPTSIGQTNPRGFAKRKSKNVYAGQLVRYRYDATRKVVGTEMQVVDITVKDCNSISIRFVARSFYYRFIDPSMAKLPTPDIDLDVSRFPPTPAKKMLPYELNKPTQ